MIKINNSVLKVLILNLLLAVSVFTVFYVNGCNDATSSPCSDEKIQLLDYFSISPSINSYKPMILVSLHVAKIPVTISVLLLLFVSTFAAFFFNESSIGLTFTYFSLLLPFQVSVLFSMFYFLLFIILSIHLLHLRSKNKAEDQIFFLEVKRSKIFYVLFALCTASIYIITALVSPAFKMSWDWSSFVILVYFVTFMIFLYDLLVRWFNYVIVSKNNIKFFKVFNKTIESNNFMFKENTNNGKKIVVYNNLNFSRFKNS